MRWGILLLVAAGCIVRAAAQPAPIVVGVPMDYQAGRPLSSAYVQGETDYARLLNGRGGIAGHELHLLNDDHANNAGKGEAIYNRMRDEGVLAVDPLSTIVAQAVTADALRDKVNLLTFYSGRSDAADGTVFPYVFPASPTYWSEAATVLHYILDQEGGSLRGKVIGFLSTENETGLGKASLPFVHALAEQLGFKLVTGFYPRVGDPSAILAEYRAARPDWTMLWDGGAGKVGVVKDLLSHGIPPQRIASLVWLSEADMAQIGDAGRGIVKFEGVATGRDTPVIKDILQDVVGKGLGSGPEANVGTTFYVIGVASVAIVAEAARVSIAAGGDPLTRQGLNIGLQHIADFTAGGLLPPMTLTATDHQGGGAGRIVEWTGTVWHPVTSWTSSYQDLVWRLIKQSSATYAAGK